MLYFQILDLESIYMLGRGIGLPIFALEIDSVLRQYFLVYELNIACIARADYSWNILGPKRNKTRV